MLMCAFGGEEGSQKVYGLYTLVNVDIYGWPLSDFNHFVSIFFLIFNAIDLHFSLILNLFGPSFSQILRYDRAQFFYELNMTTEYFMKYPPPPLVSALYVILSLR